VTKEACKKKRANLARRRRGAMAFLVACLMTSTLTEPSLGVGFGRGCEGAIDTVSSGSPSSLGRLSN
jgi:hypothetical protein